MKIQTTEEIYDMEELHANKTGNEAIKPYLEFMSRKWVSVDDLKLFLQKGANANWEAEQIEKEILKHNISCSNICNIASDLRYKLNQLFEKIGGHI